MNILEIESLNVSVDETDLIQGLNLTVNENEYWGILGRNGIGKTTLLYAMLGLRPRQAGSIRVYNKEIDDYAPKALARIMGILFQNSQDTFPVTVIEAAMAGRYPHLKPWSMYTQADLDVVDRALKSVEMSDMAYRYVNTLSGGERRRVAIASLLVQSPRIWLLDEPTNHLDIHYQVMMLDLLKQQAIITNGAIIMVLHDVNMLTRFCTHAVLMIDSKRTISGKVEDIINRENIEALYNHPVMAISGNNTTMYIPE